MAGYARTVTPSAMPLDLDTARRHCRIDSHDEDAYVSGLIAKATEAFQRQYARQFITATYTLTLDAFPDEIELQRLPVASVSSIVYVDTDGVSQTLSASSYQTDKVCGNAPCRIKPAYGLTWPSTRGGVYAAVIVTFTAGYGTSYTSVPDPVRHAIALAVAHWYENREPINIGNIVTPIDFALDYLLACEDWGCYA